MYCWVLYRFLNSKRDMNPQCFSLIWVSTLHLQKSGRDFFLDFDLEMCLVPQWPFHHPNSQKRSILTWKCAARNSRVHFFNI